MPLTVLYDGDCGVCSETVRQLRRWDHESKFEFLAFEPSARTTRNVSTPCGTSVRYESRGSPVYVFEHTGQVWVVFYGTRSDRPE